MSSDEERQEEINRKNENYLWNIDWAVVEVLNDVGDLTKKTIELSEQVLELKIQNAKLFSLKYLLISASLSGLIGATIGILLSLLLLAE